MFAKVHFMIFYWRIEVSRLLCINRSNKFFDSIIVLTESLKFIGFFY